MRKVIKGYATDYTVTKNLLQKTCTEGKVAVFGMPAKKGGGGIMIGEN